MKHFHCLCVAVFCFLVWGCSTGKDDRATYTRDGIEYGTTEGNFRGRWWSYYERGRSFQDGRFWERAEEDLRVALGLRRNDQLWARTYGLHFESEYFPQRELGVTLFYQDRFDEAIPYLESRLEDYYSARAAFFLDEARASYVRVANTDKLAPTIAFDRTEQLTAFAGLEFEITGTVTDDTYIRSLHIDGIDYPIRVSEPNITFAKLLYLAPGTNFISVVAEDVFGRTTTEEFRFVSDVDGPALSFDLPIGPSGIIRGVAYDEAGVDSLHIDGIVAALTLVAEGLVEFEVHVVASAGRFECRDSLGNVTTGVLPGQQTASVPRAGSVVFAATTDGQLQLREPRIEFANLTEGQQYLKDEIVVNMNIRAGSAIQSLELNGLAVEGLIPGRSNQRVSRRVRIEREGENIILASATDVDGRIGDSRVVVERALTVVESIESKISLALLGNVWHQKNETFENEAEFVLEKLGIYLKEHERFNLLSRDEMPEILAEQELIAALGSSQERARLRSIIPAELFVIGKLRRSLDNLEIVLQAVDTETSEIVAYADVSGPVLNTDDLSALVDDLAIRLEQEFPRVQGIVVDVRSPERFFSDLNAQHRIRPNMKCIVFRYGEEIIHPVTGESLGAPTEILAEGVFDQVQERLSRIAIPSATGTQQNIPIKVLDLVITK